MNRRRVTTALCFQQQTMECGLAALAIVLRSFGRDVALDDLRARVHVSREGTTARLLRRIAAEYGLKARGFKTTPQGLRALPLPIVAHMNFVHFVVIEGFGKDAVYVNDPACGPIDIPWHRFDLAFTGTALTFHGGDVRPSSRINAPRHALATVLRAVAWRGLVARARTILEHVLRLEPSAIENRTPQALAGGIAGALEAADRLPDELLAPSLTLSVLGLAFACAAIAQPAAAVLLLSIGVSLGGLWFSHGRRFATSRRSENSVSREGSAFALFEGIDAQRLQGRDDEAYSQMQGMAAAARDGAQRCGRYAAVATASVAAATLAATLVAWELPGPPER